MFEAADPLSRPFNTDLPERAPSAARLAAEAFFAPAPDPSLEASSPAVVVKKSKLEEPSPALSAGTPETGEPHRQPRVFRLAAPPVAADEAAVEAPETASTAEAVEVVKDGQPTEELRPAPRAVTRRRKRRALHGEVTITRPVAPVPAVDAAHVVAEVGDPEHIPVSSLGSASPVQGAAPGNTRSVASASHQWPRYLGMRRQLLSLQAEAQAAKAREAREALAWIKRATTEYGLTAADLGPVR